MSLAVLLAFHLLSVRTVCGELGDGVLTRDDGKTVELIYAIGATFDEHLRALDAINARFVGSKVCIVGDEAEGVIFVERLDAITRDPNALVRHDVETRDCELFVDKVAPVYTYHELSPMGSYSSLDLRFYVKLDLAELDAPVRAVRFYGTTEYDDGAAAFHFPPIAGTPWLGAADYYELTGLAEDGALRRGALYVETSAGTRYWLNPQRSPNAQFVIDRQFVSDAEQAFGAYGQRLPPPDGSYRAAPAVVQLDMSALPVTADVYPYLNPGRCR
jgi:hypothetical protein